MIARILVWLLALIALPDLYIHWHYLRRRRGYNMLWRIVYWLPGLLMITFTLALSAVGDFVPARMEYLYFYLLLLGLLVVPKALFALCSVLGLAACKLLKRRQNWGNLVGFFLALGAVFVVIYGSTVGPRRLKVRHVEFSSADLPAAFDGYRIVHFSDAHVGTYLGDTQFLQRAVDSINAQHADAIAFTGDLQNTQPSELDPVQGVLSQLHAADGVFSVLGNHDYAHYIKADFATEALNESLIKSKERAMGWQLLLNEHRTIRRGRDSIVVAGMENSGRKPFPDKGDIKKTLEGVGERAFVVMLQHDPTAWRRTILPDSNAQLTLSGHTHGGQMRLFGWSPASLAYDEWGGLYHEARRALCVSTGLGGLVPFRFGLPPEIVVVTLRSEAAARGE